MIKNYQKLSKDQHHNKAKKQIFYRAKSRLKTDQTNDVFQWNPIPKKILVDTPLLFPFYEGYKNAQITFAPVRIRVEEFGALFSGFWLLLLTLSWSLGAAVVLVPSLRARYSAH